MTILYKEAYVINQKLHTKPEALANLRTHYCAGCTHGIIHRIIAELVDELDLRELTVGISPVGCAVFAGNYFNFDVVQAAHGRAPAVATGVKRVNPKNFVFTYQGDGDLASIGMAEFLHAAIRGESITTIFINNACYGMTGGQMAPTSLLNQRTTTTPDGRKKDYNGEPVLVAELLSHIGGAVYVNRVSAQNPHHIAKAKIAIKEAFLVQLNNLGYSFVEVLSTCPTNWNMTPIQSIKWVETEMLPFYKLGKIKDPGAVVL